MNEEQSRNCSSFRSSFMSSSSLKYGTLRERRNGNVPKSSSDGPIRHEILIRPVCTSFPMHMFSRAHCRTWRVSRHRNPGSGPERSKRRRSAPSLEIARGRLRIAGRARGDDQRRTQRQAKVAEGSKLEAARGARNRHPIDLSRSAPRSFKNADVTVIDARCAADLCR